MFSATVLKQCDANRIKQRAKDAILGFVVMFYFGIICKSCNLNVDNDSVSCEIIICGHLTEIVFYTLS